MTVTERINICRLAEQIAENSDYANKIGVKVVNIAKKVYKEEEGYVTDDSKIIHENIYLEQVGQSGDTIGRNKVEK